MIPAFLSRFTSRPLRIALTALAGLFVSLAPVAPAHAALVDVAVSNLGENADDAFHVLGGFDEGIFRNIDLAGPFVAGNAALLSDVTISFGPRVGANLPIVVGLHADNGGLPGALLATLSGPANPENGFLNYTASPAVPLSAGTQYWIAASVAANGPDQDYALNVTGSTASGGDPGWSIGRLALRIGGNGSYLPWEQSPDRSLIFSVQVVPEPAAATLLAAAGLLLAGRRRRL